MLNYDLSPLFRSTVGFDRVMRLLDSAVNLESQGNGYPPYNIEKTGENSYRIVLAVAGFSEGELNIEQRQNTLFVWGKKEQTNDNVTYLHRGLAARAFERRFELADHVNVVSAKLENGLLQIELVHEVPEALKPRRIPVGTGQPSFGAQKTKVIEGSKAA